MDSINTLKGYDKVGYIEGQSSSLHNHNKSSSSTTTITKRKFIVILISTIILSTLFIFMVATTLIHHTTTKSNHSNSNSNSILAVCNLTNYIESCTTSLQNFNTAADPEMLLQFSLQVSLQQITNLSSLPQLLLLKVNDPRVKSGLLDCESLFTDAVDSLNSSISLMKVGPGEKMLSVQKINDIKTWVSAAMTNLDTCLDGLDETGSSLHDEMEKRMKNAKEYTSNSLAIVAKIETLLDELHIPMH